MSYEQIDYAVADGVATITLNRTGGTGVFVLFNYIQAVYMLPYAVLAVPIATVVFPRLSRQVAEAERVPHRRPQQGDPGLPRAATADEADALDYNLDFGRDPAIFDGRVAARESDHDPVLVGLRLDQKAPTLVSATPRDNAGSGTDPDVNNNPAVPVGSDITLTFSEAVRAGSGTITAAAAGPLVPETVTLTPQGWQRAAAEREGKAFHFAPASRAKRQAVAASGRTIWPLAAACSLVAVPPWPPTC